MFLDICHQYLNCRKLMDAKYQEVDECHRIANYSINCCIPSEDNSSNEAYLSNLPQQQSLDGTPVKSLAEVYQAAEQILPTFENTLTRIVSRVQEQFSDNPSIQVTVAPLKGRNRAQEKAEDDYMDRMPGPEVSWLYDIVRGSIAFSSADQLLACLDILQKEDPSVLKIVKVKNRFQNPTLTGYRDINIHMQVKDLATGFHHVCEVQIHHQALKALSKELKSHTYYEFFRRYFAGATEALEDRLNDLKLISSEDGATLDEYFLTRMLEETTEEERLLRLANLFDQQLCEHDWAFRVLQRLLDIRVEAYGGTEHFMVADSYNQIGNVLQKKGDLGQSMGAYEKAQAIFSSILKDHCDFSGSLATVNSVIRSQLKLGEALKAHGESLKSHLAIFDSGKSILKNRFKSRSRMARTEDALIKLMEHFHCDLDNTLFRPSADGDKSSDGVLKFIEAEDMLQKNLGAVNEAIPSFRSAMAAFHQAEEGGISGADASENASVAIRALDQFDKEVLETLRQALGQVAKKLVDMQTRIAIIYNNQATVLQLQGDFDGAMDKFQTSLAIKKKTLGEDNSQVAERYVYLGNILQLLGRPEVALGRYDKALLIYQNTLGEEHSLVADTLVRRANLLSAQGRRDEAMEHYFKAIGIYKRTLGEEHLSVANAYMKVGETFQFQGNNAGALEKFQQAAEIQKVALGENDVTVAETYLLISKLLGRQGRIAEANETYSRFSTIKRNSLSPENAALIESKLERARALRNEGNYDEAMTAYQNALDVSQAALGSEHESLAQIYNEMAGMLSHQGSFGRAINLYYKALGVLEKAHGESLVDQTIETYMMIGDTLQKQNRLDKSLRIYGEAIEMCKTRFGDEHAKVQETYRKIADILEINGNGTEAKEYRAEAGSMP